MKKILIISSLLGLGYWIYKKVKSVNIDKISFFIMGIGEPSVNSGMIYIPVSIGIDNQTGISINASTYDITFSADINVIQANGDKTTIFKGVPDTPDMMINNNQLNRIDIKLYAPVISLGLNALSLLSSNEIELVVYPSILGKQLNPVKYGFKYDFMSKLLGT